MATPSSPLPEQETLAHPPILSRLCAFKRQGLAFLFSLTPSAFPWEPEDLLSLTLCSMHTPLLPFRLRTTSALPFHSIPPLADSVHVLGYLSGFSLHFNFTYSMKSGRFAHSLRPAQCRSCLPALLWCYQLLLHIIFASNIQLCLKEL